MCGPLRLGRVLDDREPSLRRQLDEGSHRGHLTVEVHGDDRPGVRAERGGDQLRVDQRVLVAVDQNGVGPGADHGLRRRDERVRRDDDLVAGADPEAPEHQFDRLGTVRDADGAACAAVGREVGLERSDVGAIDV